MIYRYKFNHANIAESRPKMSRKEVCCVISQFFKLLKIEGEIITSNVTRNYRV